MAYPKFIITGDGHLRLGMVRLHRDLLLPGDTCLGGGFYRFDYVGCRLILERASYDYGPPRWGRLERLVVEELYRGLGIVYVPDGRGEDPLDLASLLNIEYE